MEKNLQEEEMKELEEEIDLAVDRLFVEKRKGENEVFLQKPHHDALISESPEEPAKGFDLFQTFESPAAVPPPPPAPPSYLKSMDQLEAHLLSLEWEITKEKLEKTQEAIKDLRNLLRQREDIGSVLGDMEYGLNQMMADENTIRPSMMKYLLEAKETIKLLLRGETDNEISIYKQLAFEGIQARFAALKDSTKTSQPVVPSPAERQGLDWIPVEREKWEEWFRQWNSFEERIEGVLVEIRQRLSHLEQGIGSRSPSGENRTSPLTDVTLFKSYGKVVGVESLKISKLFKIPLSFHEKYAHASKVRLKNDEVTLIDLKEVFPEESWIPEGVPKLVMIREGEQYKGLIVEEVLKRMTTSLEERREEGKPFLGVLQWTYQAHPVEVPILDLRRV